MTKRVKGMLVGDTFYKTKKEVHERLQKIFYGYGLFEKISEETAEDDFRFLLGVIENHPCADEKIGCGIDHFYIGINPLIPNKRLPCLKRLDGTEEDWSFIKCLGNMKKQEQIVPLLLSPVEQSPGEKKEENKMENNSLGLNCWKVQKEGKTHYVTLFDNENTMYKYVMMGGCHFSEKGCYLVTYKYLKEKTFQSGKPYKSLYGVHILSKISYQEYKSGEYSLPERAIGEVIDWSHGNQVIRGEITAIEHDEDSGEYLYHVWAKHPYIEDIITEQEIFEETEQQAV